MRHAALVATLTVCAIIVGACGGGSTPRAEPSLSTPTVTASSPSPSPVQTTPRPARSVIIADNEFQPMQIDVSVGTNVTWVHTGSARHTVTARDGSFDARPRCPTDLSQCMDQGESFSHTFSDIGRFDYYCKIHGNLMTGTVTVT